MSATFSAGSASASRFIFAGCCARPAIGDMATPPIIPMNSRRLMPASQDQDAGEVYLSKPDAWKVLSAVEGSIFGWGPMSLWVQQRLFPSADIAPPHFKRGGPVLAR